MDDKIRITSLSDLHAIIEKIGENSIFRGHSEPFDKISSTLYRKYEKKKKKEEEKEEIWNEYFLPYQAEKETVEKAKGLFSQNTSLIEILTDLRHHGGAVNLLDFSRSLYVALFFACNGKFDKDGELIVLDTEKVGEEKDVNYQELKKKEDSIFVIEPAPTSVSKNRVEAQHSVFVYVKSGTLPKNSHRVHTRYTIDKEFKNKLIDHLKKVHNINPSTIYNDVQGFIANEENFNSATIEFYRALSSYEKGNFNKALDHYDKAIGDIEKTRGGIKKAPITTEDIKRKIR